MNILCSNPIIKVLYGWRFPNGWRRFARPLMVHLVIYVFYVYIYNIICQYLKIHRTRNKIVYNSKIPFSEYDDKNYYNVFVKNTLLLHTTFCFLLVI